ncbi:hypothetical protein vBSsoS008_056 [Shigella phage vB_SsoS_008]|nr:hypothetical protein vBSsoS008_056 [Shigella phage vB_SsoS_008]
MSAAFVGAYQVNGVAQLVMQGVPFGMWDNPNVTLESDINTIWCRDAINKQIDDVGAFGPVVLALITSYHPQGQE